MTLFRRADRADTSFMRTILPFPCCLPSSAVVAAMVLALAAPALSQSLADVARQEGQRRKEQSRGGKVYTNDNLRRDFTASATPAEPGTSAPAATDPPAPAVASEADTASEPKKDETYWKGRLASAREQLERAQSFAAALESQINGLTVDFVNRDDPAQRSAVEANRRKAVAEHERVRREIEGHKKAIAAVEDEARKAGVPPGWLR